MYHEREFKWNLPRVLSFGAILSAFSILAGNIAYFNINPVAAQLTAYENLQKINDTVTPVFTALSQYFQ